MIFVLDNYDSFTYNLVHLMGSLGPEMLVERKRETSVAAIMALRPDNLAPAAFFPNLWHGMTDVAHGPIHFSAATLCRILLTALATLLAILWSAGRLDRYKISRSAAVLRIIYLTLSISLLTLVFLPDSRYPVGLATALPVSLLLNEYFGVPDRKKGLKG